MPKHQEELPNLLEKIQVGFWEKWVSELSHKKQKGVDQAKLRREGIGMEVRHSPGLCVWWGLGDGR